MIDLTKAQKSILKATPVLGRESVPILNALGRILYQNIPVSEDLPASDISALDGYAVCRKSLDGVSLQHPVHLQIIGESRAGKPFSSKVGHKKTVRIMTGGVVPAGADAILKIEDTREKDGNVICTHDPGKGRGIRYKGDSLKKGQALLGAGEVISPLEIGALAGQRRAYVFVHRRPVVAILSTGDELSDFHEPASPSKAMCSNLYTLAALVKETGAIPFCLGIARDELEDQHCQLQEALHSDVIITSGGTSKGKYDLIHKVLSSLGMEIRFSSVFAKPGKPTIFGTVNSTMIFGLPGNPTASILSFEQFIKPALLKMMGHPNVLELLAGQAQTGDPFSRIDSFNQKYGGNKAHKRASQVPLKNKRISTLEKGQSLPDRHIPLSSSHNKKMVAMAKH